MFCICVLIIAAAAVYMVEASVSSVLNATINGKLMMGYSNPYTSATGLNFLLAALASSGSDTIYHLQAPQPV